MSIGRRNGLLDSLAVHWPSSSPDQAVLRRLLSFLDDDPFRCKAAVHLDAR